MGARRPLFAGSPAVAVVAGALALAVLAGACSAGATDERRASTPAPTGTAAPTTPAAPHIDADPEPPADLRAALVAAGLPVFDGTGDFYEPPSPLPPGAPGDLLRVEPVARAGLEGVDVVRVMYHSRTRDDTDVPVTGLIAVPHTTAPPGGRAVVSWAHGTSGLAPQCAPSRGPDAFNRNYVDAGYVVAATDYYGLGPPGLRHPYLAGITEGRAVIDIVRAAQQLPFAHAGDQWVGFGHSQGGHAVLFAAQIQPSYAPETRMLGAVAMAPVGDLQNLVPYAASPIRGIGVMIVFGLAEDNPDLKPAEFLTPRAMELSSVLTTGCNGDIAQTYMTALAPNDLLAKDPGVFEPAATILRANNPGTVKTPVPVLIVHGEGDYIVPPGRSETIFEDQCALGQTVQRTVYPTADHSTIVEQARADIEAWIAARLRGEPAPSNCR